MVWVFLVFSLLLFLSSPFHCNEKKWKHEWNVKEEQNKQNTPDKPNPCDVVVEWKRRKTKDKRTKGKWSARLFLFPFLFLPFIRVLLCLFFPLVRFMLSFHYIITEPKRTKAQIKHNNPQNKDVRNERVFSFFLYSIHALVPFLSTSLVIE